MNTAKSQSAESWRRALEMTAPIVRNPSIILPTVMRNLAGKLEHAPAIVCGAERMSYRSLVERMDHYARWAIAENLVAGDVVCLLMPNCPDYLAIWLGITSMGATVSLLNTNLRDASLEYAIALVAPKALIVGRTLYSSLLSTRAETDSEIKYFVHEGDAAPLEIRKSQEEHSANARRFQVPTIRDTALYIYTSGTTGMPKAVRISHFRLMQWSHWFAGLMGVDARDRMYNCLPMYHSAGGVVATGATLVGGGSIVLRDKFSAGAFWAEIRDWECTLFQYIGEMCRFLLMSPARPRESEHRIRLCCGNGLSGAVWTPFQERFRIPRILEFYAATEGALSLYNCEGRPGVVGRIPKFLAHRFQAELVRCDPDSGAPFRGEDGFCVRCATGEPGHAISRISEGAGPGAGFEGYTAAGETEKKILRDVFACGDAWYWTGDLMKRDKAGYYCFVDRVGDTFRWKGENVSTTEVADIIGGCNGILDGVVYGVAVPEQEGRAGMTAILTNRAFDLADFHRELVKRLPPYARPVFLRVLPSIRRTETFKAQKQALRHDGYDPGRIADKLYFNDGEAFVPLDACLHEAIQSGVARM